MKTSDLINTDVTEAEEKIEYPESASIVMQYEEKYFLGIVMETSGNGKRNTSSFMIWNKSYARSKVQL